MNNIIERNSIVKLYNGRELVVVGNTYEEDGDIENLNYYCKFLGRDNEINKDWYDIMVSSDDIKWVRN